MDTLAALAAGRVVREPAAIVLAHPDDELVSLGSRLALFSDLTLIHLTDGAPRDLRDARRAGFADRQAYAAARERELRAALDTLDVKARRISLGLPDQETVSHLSEIVGRLRAELVGMRLVFSHPYEHGHPDHDSAALAVALAAPELSRFEFASYHLVRTGPRFGAFWPDPACPETAIRLTREELAAKAAAVTCFATQAETLAQFDLSVERIRRAPTYDFSAPAPPGAALYEQWGFPESAAGWRARAAQLLEPAWA